VKEQNAQYEELLALLRSPDEGEALTALRTLRLDAGLESPSVARLSPSSLESGATFSDATGRLLHDRSSLTPDVGWHEAYALKRRKTSAKEDYVGQVSKATKYSALTYLELDNTGQMESMDQVLRDGYIEIFGNLPSSSSISANGYSQEIQSFQLQNFRQPVHTIQTLWNLDDAPICQLFRGYRDMCRDALAADNWQLDDPDEIDVTLFFMTEKSPLTAIPSIGVSRPKCTTHPSNLDGF